jgi:general secretion pathway protein B
MSYILEALKKSEQQRQIGRVPGITSVHESTAQAASKTWLWVIVAVLLLNVGLLVLLLWPEPEADSLASVARDEPSRTPLEPAVTEPPSAEAYPPAERPRTAIRAPRAESPHTSLQKTRSAAESAPVETVAIAETPPAQPPSVARETGTAEQTALVEPAATPEALPQQLPSAATPGLAVSTEVPALPVWPQIPRHLFQQMSGSLRLDVHVFSEDSAERFVLMNMQKYREGEKLQEGPQLDEITPEGVILSLGGQKFTVRAQ